jgi:small subunit ribosomal protein S1
MNDMEKPTEAPTPAPEAPAPEKQEAQNKPDRVQLLREKAASRAKPVETPRPPSLQHEVTYGFGKKIDAFDDEMERQLQEAMGGMSTEALLGEPEQHGKRGKPAVQEGPKKGKVFRIHGQDVFIDLPGGRSQGVMPIMQFPTPPNLGDEIEVHIDGFDNANGLLILSRKGAAVEANWESVAEGQIVEARVTETNKGGLAVVVNGIRGFMPISQIELFRVENLEPYVNQRLLCMVAEVDPVERNLVVSRRALLDKEREENREKLWATLAEGQVYQGVVRQVKDFGAFVDIGGVDGLLHVSEMSWERVPDATKVLEPGQSVKVVVLKIDRDKRRLSLGAKQLVASPWDDAATKYAPSSTVKGTVSRVAEFGAFVELEPAIEGLIHISELAPQRVRRVTDIVKVGQEVQVVVLNVDVAARRISLSLKAALPQEPEPVEEEAVEEEPAQPVKPPKPRTTPLRGGTGASSGNLIPGT